MSEEEYDVQVYVYDLSHGLARIYSPMVLGTTIEAIYHTSVVVRNKEYYLDQGIKVNSPPGHTKYGTPIEVLNIGKTSVDDELINDFLNDLRNHDEMKYHAINYNLFTNNCNHFSDVLLEFLCGINLEDRILKLPELVLNTPNGQMLQQMIGGVNF